MTRRWQNSSGAQWYEYRDDFGALEVKNDNQTVWRPSRRKDWADVESHFKGRQFLKEVLPGAVAGSWIFPKSSSGYPKASTAIMITRRFENIAQQLWHEYRNNAGTIEVIHSLNAIHKWNKSNYQTWLEVVGNMVGKYGCKEVPVAVRYEKNGLQWIEIRSNDGIIEHQDHNNKGWRAWSHPDDYSMEKCMDVCRGLGYSMVSSSIHPPRVTVKIPANTKLYRSGPNGEAIEMKDDELQDEAPRAISVRELRLKEGKCPECGELGRYHMCQAICSKHGAY